MSTVFEDVVAWLRAQQDWLQLAAELLASGGPLSDEDVDRVVLRLKSSEGRAVTTTRNFAGLDGTATSEAELHLQSVGDIQGIEILAPSRPLDFGRGKLVVVYGPNGSGKSGYTRILKKICGKPSGGSLRPNVFQPSPAERGCTVCYTVGTDGKTASWHPGDGRLPELHAEDVFDEAAAEAYLQSESVPSYAPATLRFFANLAHCCNLVGDRLEAARAQLVTTLPALPQSFQRTAVARVYQQLRANTLDEQLSRLVDWSEADQQSLDQLGNRLNVKDPAAGAHEARAKNAQVVRLVSELEATGAAFSADRLSTLKAAGADAEAKREIAAGVAKACTESAELGGIGTETWKALWEAARSYSRIPYPDRAFPVTAGEARCVLCHQTLSDDAGRRLVEFEALRTGQGRNRCDGCREEICCVAGCATNCTRRRGLSIKLRGGRN